MPGKPDIKRNYYADLELSSDASIEEIKKQYRKLALKYHPDRNPGKEAEIVSKFQAIQAAHEVLEDSVLKAKYDADRRKAGLIPTFGRAAPTTAPRPQNAYAANSNPWPPPPRRNPSSRPAAESTWNPKAPPSGADRFTNFPRPAPTSKKESDKTNVFTAWQNMNRARAEAANTQPQQPQQPRPQPKGAFGTSPQKQRPGPPPRADTRFPTEEEIRAGMKYRAAAGGSGGGGGHAGSTAWQGFNNFNAGKPGMARSNTTKTPKKSGFDPTAGGDEGQAGSTANYSSYRSRTKSDDARTYPPPPPPNFRESVNTNTSSGANDAPYTEGSRTRTPYSNMHSSDNLHGSNNSNSARDGQFTAKKTPTTHQRPNGTARKPFVVEDSSDESDSDQSATASDNTTPEHAQPRKPNPELNNNPFLRPRRTPVPPSSRTASPFKQSIFDTTRPDLAAQQNSNSNALPQQPQQPTEKGKNNMYASPSPDSFPTRIPSPKLKTWSKLGSWAIPSTVLPSKRNASPSVLHSTGDTKKKISSPSDDLKVKVKRSYAEDLQGLHLDPSPRRYSSQKDAHMSAEHQEINESTGFTFPVDSNTFAPAPPSQPRSSRSEENINTTFTPSQWAGTFSANNVFAAPAPPRKPNSPARKSSRNSRSHASGTNTPNPPAPFSQYAENAPQDASPAPPSPQTAQPVKFSAEDWAKTMKDASWVLPEPLRSEPSFSTSTSRPVSRGRKASAAKSSAVKVSVTKPIPATATAVEDESAAGASVNNQQRASPSQPGVADDLMDVDMGGVTPEPPTPVPTTAASPATASPFTAVNGQQKEPRFVQVDPSPLRQSTSNTSTKRNSSGPALKTKLDDLASVLSEPTTGEGIANLKDISSTLPFESKPSSKLPTKNYAPQILNLPKLPVPPQHPTKLTKTSWSKYCEMFSRYLTKYFDFDRSMLSHFNARRQLAEDLIMRGVSELQSVGGERWLNYKKSVEEDERVRLHWGIGNERHLEAVRGFEGVKERVKTLSEGAGLADI